MNAAALEYALRVFAHRRPFRAFWLEFVTGERVKVTHPELVMRWREVFVFRASGGDVRLFAAESVCQLLAQNSEHP